MAKNCKNKSELKKKKKINPKLNINNLIEKLKKVGIKKETLRTINKIYNDYQKYFFKNKNTKTSTKQNTRRILINDFYEKNSVNEYINSLLSNCPSTRKKKKYILNKVLTELKTGNIKIRKDHSDKNYLNNHFLLRNESFLNLINEIFSSNDLNMIIIYQIVFELGISLIQLSKIKVKNIKNDYKYIIFKYKGIQKYKVLSFYSSTLLKYYILTNALNKEDHLLFPDIKLKDKEKRFNAITERIKSFLNKLVCIKKSIREKFLSEINEERKKSKINRLEIERKTDFYNKIWNYLNLYFLENSSIQKNANLRDSRENKYPEIFYFDEKDDEYDLQTINDINFNTNEFETLNFNVKKDSLEYESNLFSKWK